MRRQVKPCSRHEEAVADAVAATMAAGIVTIMLLLQLQLISSASRSLNVSFINSWLFMAACFCNN